MTTKDRIEALLDEHVERIAKEIGTDTWTRRDDIGRRYVIRRLTAELLAKVCATLTARLPRPAGPRALALPDDDLAGPRERRRNAPRPRP